MTASGATGRANDAEALLRGQCPHQAPAEERAEGEAADRAEHGHDHRLPAQRRAQLRPGLADGPQQPELPRPLVDRQRQRVADAHQGDQHGDAEQAVDHEQHLVDLARRSTPRYSSRVCGSGAPKRSVTGGDGGLAVLDADTVGERRRTAPMSIAWPGVGRPVLAGHDDVARTTSARSKTAPISRSAVVAVDERHRHDVTEPTACSSAHCSLTATSPAVDVGQRAGDDAEVEDRGERVPGPWPSARRLSPSMRGGTERRRRRRRRPPAARRSPGPARSASSAPLKSSWRTTRSPVNVVVDGVVDRRLDGGTERGEQGHDGGADHQGGGAGRRCAGGCASRCAGRGGR